MYNSLPVSNLPASAILAVKAEPLIIFRSSTPLSHTITEKKLLNHVIPRPGSSSNIFSQDGSFNIIYVTCKHPSYTSNKSPSRQRSNYGHVQESLPKKRLNLPCSSPTSETKKTKDDRFNFYHSTTSFN